MHPSASQRTPTTREPYTMRGLIQEGNGEEHVRLSENLEHATAVGPRQVRVVIMAAGVCGSDSGRAPGKHSRHPDRRRVQLGHSRDPGAPRYMQHIHLT